jgi:hypothetical protein
VTSARAWQAAMHGVIGPALLATLIVACNAQTHPEPPNAPLQQELALTEAAPNPGAQTQSISMRGMTLRVPQNHLILLQQDVQKAVILQGLWPDFAPVTDENWQEFGRHGGAHIVLHVRGEALENPHLTAERSIANGVEIRLRSRLGPSETHATSFGLVERRAVGFRPSVADNLGRSDYFTPATAQDSLHIFCASRLSGTISHPDTAAPCEQIWAYRGLEIEARYYRWLLPHWADVKARVERLIDAFVVEE